MNHPPAAALLFALVLAATVAWPVSGLASESVFEHFVKRSGDTLVDGDKPVRFISWNIPNLHNVEDAFTFLGETPWRWPDEYEIADALETTKQMGGAAVRTYVLSVRREGADMGGHVHVLAPGQFNEEAFQALDKVLAIANEKGVRVIIPLVDQWHWWGGIRQYEAFRGKPEDAFWTDPQLIADFKRTIDFVVNRRNTVTGQLYKDDKAILCWETGNEISSPAAWTHEIAAYIRSIDANHLVMDGRSLHGVPEWSLDDPNIDIVTTHHYPGGERPIPEVIRDAAAMAAGKRPYLVGEVGFIPNDQLREIFDDAIASKTVGVLLWSLRFRNRDGGFYAHSEPASGGRYKAYHWPGFASGASYDEAELLHLMREKAFAIRGEAAPPRSSPGAVKLLRVDDPARITWRGPTGASSYDIERATAADGPWRLIASDVCDADGYYRPLFADSTAQPGESYYYRVTAKNPAGKGLSSNIEGPVEATCSTLVDELRDLKQVAITDGAAELVSDNARAVQEDPHRLRLEPGASVAYDVTGPVTSVTTYLFAPQGIEVEVKLVGEDGSPLACKVKQESPDRTAGDYGYLSPVLITATPEAGRGRRVVISAPADAEGAIQLSRVEVRYGPTR